MKDAYYFSHDANARHDTKILAMRSIYKAEGYGWYWMIIEMMREQDNYKLPLSGKYKYDSIAMQLNCDPKEVEIFINDCIEEFNLFESDGIYIWIDKLKFKKKKSIKHSRIYEINVEFWYKIRKWVFKRDNYTCKYCSNIGGILEVDHIIPISKDGNNYLSNLTTSCRKCNRQKKDKTIEEFKKWQENQN